MKSSILLFLLIISSSFAQTPPVLKTQKEKLKTQKQINDDWEKEQLKLAAEAKEALAQIKTESDRLDSLMTNRKANIEKVNDEISAKLKSFSTAERLISRKAGFYRCVRDSIKDRGITDVPLCKRIHEASFDEEDNRAMKSWGELLGLTPSEVKFQREKLKWDVQIAQTKLDNANKQLGHAVAMKERQEAAEKELAVKEADQKLIEANSKYINCDAGTPDISLEEKVPYPGATFKGPFVGVPRDNQDGLGTCYANTAKNLLVGTSKGEDVASFLDLALAYKGVGGVVSSGLDAGLSCTALDRLKAKGFCPQANAPMETGEKNIAAGGLMGKGSMYDQSRVVSLLQKFFADKETLTKGNKEFADQILGQAKAIIHNLQLRPNIKVPLPIVRNPIPPAWKLVEMHSILQRNNPYLGLDDVMKDYQTEYRKFYPSYIRSVMEGRSREDIFNDFTIKMAPFISKYHVQNDLKYWKTLFMNSTEADAKDPNLKKSIAESVEFMKLMSGKQGKSDEEFLKFCDDTMGDSLQFMNALQPLLKYLSENKIDTDLLFDKSGRFKSPTDLMQLAIAPACLSPENRKPFGHDISCSTGNDTISAIKNSNQPYEAKKKEMRGKVVASLLQGYPLGNTFARHINTIVGLRFNKELNRCEYKIRESQNGTSTWQSESQIFDVISALTEVRRK